MTTIRRSLIWAIAAVLFVATAPVASAQAPLSADEARQLGIEAYIYGYPLVTMEMTRRVMTNVAAPDGNRAPMGQFANMKAYPDATFRDVTAPNADTLYSSAWIDVKQQPYVVTIPDEAGRYFLIPMLSGWTDVIASPGKRTTGTKAQTYAITGPGYRGNLPPGVTEVKSPTSLVWILGRTYCTGTPEDYRAVHAIQAKYTLTPLSAFGTKYTPPAGHVDPSIDMKTPVRDQVNRLSATDYFRLLATLLNDNPPAAADAPMVAKLARLGIVPGGGFDPSKLDPAAARALAEVPAAAFAEIMDHEADAGEAVNGWIFSTRTGLYDTDYLQRAFVTAIGLGANRPEDAIYPKTGVDSDGEALSGENRYVIHFPAGQTPPVNGFWSLTMYDAAYFFSANPLNRYTLSPRDALKYNPDGSLDLWIGHESPGKDRESNWLPAPKGAFSLMLRLYWPKDAVIAGRWNPPAVQQVVETGPGAGAAVSARPDDAKAIAALDQSFIAAFNKGDARAIADLFAADAEITDDSGETIRGRDAIARHFASTFAQDPKAKIELAPDSLRFLGADAARQTGRARTIPGNGGSPDLTRFTVLYVRRDGRWLHDSIHEHEDRNLTAHDRLTELEWLVGDWVDEADDGVVHTSCRWSDDKNFLIRDFTMHIAGMPISSGSQRIGWDAKKQQIRSWVFDGDGGHSDGFWTRSGKDEWTIQASGILADGRDVKATQILTFVNKGLCRWTSIDREIDGEPMPDLPEIVLVRTPPRPGGSVKSSR